MDLHKVNTAVHLLKVNMEVEAIIKEDMDLHREGGIIKVLP